MRKRLIISTFSTAVALFTMLVGAAAPASAAPNTSYYVSGSDSVARGNLIWYSDAVQVGGSVTGAFYNFGAYVSIYPTTSNGTKLSGPHRRFVNPNDTTTYGFTMAANGGATYVYVDLYVNLGTGIGYRYKGSDRCTRSSCVSYSW
jgi:hypothetical protein